MIRALQRQPAAVWLLLDRGAELNGGAGPGSLTPLLLAAGDTDPAILKLLLAHGADPTVEENGATALSRAVRRHIQRTRPSDVREVSLQRPS